MNKKTLYLVCNAHLDPVWLWEWEEGLAETLSTFRTAARFCEEFPEFAFCHNEAILYRWIEEYEPELFERIRRLVGEGRWHIMGGWYLQPDCNIPSGESFVRQIMHGKTYFQREFDVEPTAAVNLDPFGHTRGLVQILKRSGYSAYLFCRPRVKDLDLPANDFLWIGYDGSEIMAHRVPDHYNSEIGKAREKIEKWIEANNDRETGVLLWGIGDHGGGPSRIDLEQIRVLQLEEPTWQIKHGRPEDYFRRMESVKDSLPRLERDLNPWAVGCYTSMAKVKQKHRLLENSYFATEKMLANAALQGLVEYPREQLCQALEDLLFCEFHDILPGSSIPEVEAYTLQRMGHGLEILARLRAKAFFSLLSGQPSAEDGEFPLFVYNPHPYDVHETVVCEFQPPEPNFNHDVFMQPTIVDCDGNEVAYQLEKESCNIDVDQRKRVVFNTDLKAASMNRFGCHLKAVEADKPLRIADTPNDLRFSSPACEVVVSKETGLIERYRVQDMDFLQPNSFQPLVIKDYADPWGMKVRAFRDVEGAFSLMTPAESAEFAGVALPELEPVRILEDGAIRTTVEALFKYNRSSLCMRYRIPKTGSEIEVDVRVYWLEKDKMLKLSIPTNIKDGRYLGQVAYGVEEFDRHGEELVAHKWIGVVSPDRENALTVINDCIHGFDFSDGEVRLSLLRSPAYSGHPVGDKITIVRQDRFEPRIDQGEAFFRFWVNADSAADRLLKIDREALVKNEPPMALCCSPAGTGDKVCSGVSLSDDAVQLCALKMAEESDQLIIRLFEPTGKERDTRIAIPFLGMEFNVSLKSFEIKTLAVDIHKKTFSEVDLLERELINGVN